MQNELSKIKDEVINKIVVMTAIFFVPPYLLSLLRWFDIGWENIYALHTILYFLALSLAIFRKKFNYFHKTVIISFLYLTISLIGLIKFALNGGFYFAIISLAILTILTKRKFAIYMNILIIILFSLVAIGYSNYMLNPVVDLNLLARSPLHWSLTIFSIFSITIIFTYGFGDFYKNLTEKISEKEKITTKLQLQKELLETSEKKYQMIFDNANDAIFLLKDNRFFDCNEKTCEYFKLSKELLIGKKVEELSPVLQYDGQESIKKAHHIISQVLSDHPQQFEWQHIKSNGEFFDASISLNKINLQGNDYIQGTLRDITEKKRIKEALIKSENKFKSLFENSADGILVLNAQNEILELNNKICEILGYSREELILLKGHQFIDSDDWAHKNQAAALEQLQQGKTLINQYLFLKKDGSSIPTELSTKMIAEGQFLNIVRDITERKLAEKVIQESEIKYRSFFENSIDAILITNTDGEIFSANPAACAMLECSEQEIIKLGRAGLVDTSDPRLQDILSVRASKGKVRGEMTLFRKDKTRFEAEISSAVFKNVGNIKFTSMIIRDITERKRAEKSLQESEEKFKLIFQTSPDFVTINLIEDGTYIDINDNYIKTSGFSREEIIGKTANDLNISIDPDDKTRLFSKLNETGKVENIETKFTFSDGRVIKGLISASILLINKKPHILAITRDITGLKIAEQAFKETAANLRSMIDNREDSIWSIDRNFNYIIFNSSYEKIINNQYNIELKKGMSSTENLTDEEAKYWVPLFESVFEGESITFEFSHVLHNEIRYFQTSLHPIIEGDIITGASGLSIDVTKRKLIEQALKLSEEKFEKSFRLSPYMVSLSTMEGQVVEVNDRVFTTLGYTKEEFQGNNTTVLPIWVNLKQREAFVNLLKKEDAIHEMEVQLRKKSGEICDYSLSACSVILNEQKLFLSIIHNITERKNAEKEIKKLNINLEMKVQQRTAQLEAMNKELETFTYSVSHDLKAPLRGIDGYSKLLSDIHKTHLNEEAQSFIEKIRNSTLQMNQIIDDLLDYSRLERSQLNISKIKIKDLIESVLSIYTTELEAGYFKVDKKFTDIEIIADPKGFIIAFRNLIENAIKFTKGKDNPAIKIEIEDNDLSWIISVNDNGIGFDMQYHHKIFDIFQRLQRAEDYPGTGIGLALVSKAMQRMNGKSWAVSIPNVGSTFYLEIPKKQ